MTYEKSSGRVLLNALELSEYAIKKPVNPTFKSVEGGFVKVPHLPISGLDYDEFTPLTWQGEREGQAFSLSAEADKIIYNGDRTTVEITRISKKLPGRFVTSFNAEFLAQAVVTAFMYCIREGKETVTLRLTFVKRDCADCVSFEREYDITLLKLLTDSLIERAVPFIKVFAERCTIRLDELKRLSFPYSDIRSGQHELMLSVMRHIRRGGRLIASAPTGTGKTMATLFPALKGIAAGACDKVFYLTGKTVTGKAAYDALSLLGKNAPTLRYISIRAKESCCISGNFADGCFTCSRMNDIVENDRFAAYKQRRATALSELLSKHKAYDSTLIREYAEKYTLCPYELSLDLSEFCDVIICDYNYVYDMKVRFRRYFEAENDGKFVFLVDEAHNLPDRVRTSYSAEFSPWMIKDATENLKDTFLTDPEAAHAFAQCKKAFESVMAYCFENVKYYSDRKGEHKAGFYRSDSAPTELITAVSGLATVARERMRKDNEAREIYKDLNTAASAFLTSTQVGDSGFAFLAEAIDDKLTCRNLCLDPSKIISDLSSCAHATVMFSATLDPIEYFADMLGFSDAEVLHAESPFDSDNMSVTIFDSISTRFSDRKETAYEVAEVIATVLESKPGHYFVFFPSYKYMRTVSRALLEISPEIKAVMQKPGMTLADREKFITAFTSKKFKSIVGLCVLGGMFSEGIDLTGDSLIGTIIVGAGLPGLSSELNLMAEYYENKYGNGHLYAYDFPAINKIEQAAGRVIRTAEDRGVVVMIDDRLSSPEIAGRFPKYWPRISCTSDTRTLSLILERFWNSDG